MIEQEVTLGSCDITGTKKLSALANLEIGKEKDFFIENLSILFSSGMDLISALDSIKAGVKSRPMLKMIEEVNASKDLDKESIKIIEKNILKLCKLTKKYPRIKELDINPLIQGRVVDARIVWH